MRIIFLLLTVLLVFSVINCQSQSQNDVDMSTQINVYEYEGDQHILLFTKTAGFRHQSIEAGVDAMLKMGEENGFSVTHTENSEIFVAEELVNFDAVVFLNTTMTLFDENQREAFKSYIQNGGGFVGVHSASDTEYDWEWYGKMVGAYFDNHPGNPNVRNAIVDLVDSDHPATSHLSEQWEREDEWYNFGYINPDTNVLLELDTDSYEGSDHPGEHPVSWYHYYDGGRAFYTALGHTDESFTEENFLNHLYGGLLFAMGIEE